MECEDCGSRNVSRRDIEGHLLYECNLCGNLEGDDRAVMLIEELRVGRERGIDDEVIPLVSVLESTGIFKIVRASAGNPNRNEAPVVLFQSTKSDTAPIENLLRSLELANRKTRLLWLIELSLQHAIVYTLRPRFWRPPSDVSPDDLRVAQKDLVVLARQLRRDLSLSWWR